MPEIYALVTLALCKLCCAQQELRSARHDSCSAGNMVQGGNLLLSSTVHVQKIDRITMHQLKTCSITLINTVSMCTQRCKPLEI